MVRHQKKFMNHCYGFFCLGCKNFVILAMFFSCFACTGLCSLPQSGVEVWLSGICQNGCWVYVKIFKH